MMRKACKHIFLTAAVLLLVCILCVTVFAADSTIDYTRKGSVTFTLLEQNSGQSPVSGAELALYQVGKFDRDSKEAAYTLSGGFEGSGVGLDDLRAEGLAKSLAAYAVENKIEGNYRKTDAGGKAVFESLELGLYLAAQKGETAHHCSFEPFLVSVPMTGADGMEWVYDVEASPKAARKVSPSPHHPPKKPPLIQTGQLNWPVPVLAGGGLILFALGWAMTNLRRKKHEE